MEIRRFLKNKVSFFGFLLVTLIIITAILSPLISPYDPLEQHMVKRFSKPSAEFFGGTDRYGRDIFSRTLWGTRISLVVGFSATAIGAILGTVLGLIAGYTKGHLSKGIMWLTDVFMSFPTMVLAIIVVVAFGPGNQNVVLAIGLAFTPRFIRLARASTLSVSEQVFIEASRATGQSSVGIIGKHVLPNIAGDIIVMSTLWIATAIRLEASLSFLGLGTQPPTPSWGNMIREGMLYFMRAPWLSLVPGAGIFFTVIGFNMLGDGMRDVLDPKLRGRLT
ncbi:MAG: ABC transporter permease [Desulfobacterales bacterium]|nr:MAG: ABC transporter permease [Desulfobacterales bacterium]